MHIVYMNIKRESQKYTEIYNVIVSSYMYKHSNRKLPDQLMHSSELFGVKFLFYNYFVNKSFNWYASCNCQLLYSNKAFCFGIYWYIYSHKNFNWVTKVAFLFQLAYTYTRFKIEHASCYSCIFSNWFLMGNNLIIIISIMK